MAGQEIEYRVLIIREGFSSLVPVGSCNNMCFESKREGREE